jgi:hypothetical protein
MPSNWLENGVPQRTKWTWTTMPSKDQESEIGKLPSNPLKYIVSDVNSLLTRTCNLGALMKEHPQTPSLAHRILTIELKDTIPSKDVDPDESVVEGEDHDLLRQIRVTGCGVATPATVSLRHRPRRRPLRSLTQTCFTITSSGSNSKTHSLVNFRTIPFHEHQTLQQDEQPISSRAGSFIMKTPSHPLH